MNCTIYKLIRGLRKAILAVQGKQFSHELASIENADEANLIIKKALESDNPCMIARYGATELLCVTNYLGIKKKRKFLKFIKAKIHE